MAEVFGKAGDPVPETGTYACSKCGHREDFTKDGTLPGDHCEEHPWMLMVKG